jgi:predicted CXXCH cytochrome family protein
VKPEELQQSAEKEKRVKKKTSKKSKVSHTVYSDFIQTIDIPRKQACGFCHSVTHREYAETISLKTCAQCHIFVQRTMSESALAAVNIHQEFVTKKCSRCHDPHSSPYEHMLQLDKELDWYKREPYNPNKMENPLPETELPGVDIEF